MLKIWISFGNFLVKIFSNFQGEKLIVKGTTHGRRHTLRSFSLLDIILYIYVNCTCTWHTGGKQEHNSVLFRNSKEVYLSLCCATVLFTYIVMKKLIILVFSCALQFTYGSEPNIEGTIIANAKSPMDRRDPKLFFGVSFVLIFNALHILEYNSNIYWTKIPTLKNSKT